MPAEPGSEAARPTDRQRQSLTAGKIPLEGWNATREQKHGWELPGGRHKAISRHDCVPFTYSEQKAQVDVRQGGSQKALADSR